MTVATPDESAVHDAVVAVLAATGRPVGDGKRPPEPVNASLYPYVIAEAPGLTAVTGTFDAPVAEGTVVQQLTSVGRLTASALWMRQLARSIVLDRALYDALGVIVTYASHEAGLPVRRDDNVTPPLFVAVDIIHIRTTA